MKASEMTNEDLAASIEFGDDILREAAKRLRTIDELKDQVNRDFGESVDLRRRLKVADDALEKCKNAMCNYCRSTPEAKGLPCLNGCETLAVDKNDLAAIRE